MNEKRRGVPLIVFGIIIIVIGIGLWVYGGIIDGNYEMHLESIFSSGHRNSTGTTMTSIGIGAIVIGAILALIGIILYATSGKQILTDNTVNFNQEKAINSDSSFIKTKFTNANGVYSVFFENNGNCIWEQQGKRYKGLYRRSNGNEWIISIDGFGDAFTFKTQGNDLFVVGGPIKEVFYRNIDPKNISTNSENYDYSKEPKEIRTQPIPNPPNTESKTITDNTAGSDTEDPSVYPTNSSDVKECLNCGEKNPLDASVCSKCGGFYFRQNSL